MTSATSAPPVHRPGRLGFTSGFTLVELLVVVGIIVILIGLLLPMIVKAMRQGNRARIASDLNAISAALDAYKGDFGDYPRIIYTNITPLNGTGSGAEVLGKALLGTGGQDGLIKVNSQVEWAYNSSTTYYPGQVVLSGSQQFAALQQTTGNAPAVGTPYWQTVTIGTSDTTGATGGGFDGADGPGSRIRGGGSGRVYGPYLQPDKFKTRGLALIDSFGNPILYYPGNPAKPSVTIQLTTNNTPPNGCPTIGNAYVSVPAGVTPGVVPTAVPVPSLSFYNYSDNDTAALQSVDSNIPNAFPDITVMEAMLGDYNMDGYIDSTNNYTENPATTASFLLWSAGPDGQYGPVAPNANAATYFKSLSPNAVKNLVIKCDDVTNFTFAQ